LAVAAPADAPLVPEMNLTALFYTEPHLPLQDILPFSGLIVAVLNQRVPYNSMESL